MFFQILLLFVALILLPGYLVKSSHKWCKFLTK